MLRVVVVCLLTLCGPALAVAQQPPTATLAERTTGMTRADGFVPFYWDAARGRVLMEIPSFNEDVLYYVSAASGGGSVELSFDRGIMGTSVVHFQRSGPRVLVVEQNLRYRAVNGHAALQETVRDSFPPWSASTGSAASTEVGNESRTFSCSAACPLTAR